jgi:hypothetical protein
MDLNNINIDVKIISERFIKKFVKSKYLIILDDVKMFTFFNILFNFLLNLKKEKFIKFVGSILIT